MKPSTCGWMLSITSVFTVSNQPDPVQTFHQRMRLALWRQTICEITSERRVRRRVNKDRTVARDRRLFEAPVELIGKRVELLYFEESPEQVEIRCSDKSYGLLRQVDLHVNSRVKRDKNGQIELAGDGETQSGRLWEGM